ncbi:hypothetical protein D3C84_919850 [compost metagenome]
MAIVIFHFAAFKIVYALLYQAGIIPYEQLAQLTPSAGNDYWLLLSIASIILCMAFDYMIRFNRTLSYALLGERDAVLEAKLLTIVREKD